MKVIHMYCKKIKLEIIYIFLSIPTISSKYNWKAFWNCILLIYLVYELV